MFLNTIHINLCSCRVYAFAGPLKDQTTIRNDVERSLQYFRPALSQQNLIKYRQKLLVILNSIIRHGNGEIHYYQGLNNISSVILLTTKRSRVTEKLLLHITVGQLRDFTRSNLKPVMELVDLLIPLVETVDT